MESKRHPALNEEQKAAAFCAENAVIAAGAGSGKTMVLASRFTWLITENEDCRVENILTLTFTKKAAAQMYRRIHALLGEIAAGDTGIKGKRAQRALDNFIHARIQTLDSYSAAIVKQAASRYGIRPDFSIDEKRCWELAMEEALPFLLAHRSHPAIEILYDYKKPYAIAYDIFATTVFNFSRMDNPPAFIEDVKKQFALVSDRWSAPREIIMENIQKLQDIIFSDTSLLPDLFPLMRRVSLVGLYLPTGPEIRSYFDNLLHSPAESWIERAKAAPVQNALNDFFDFMQRFNRISLKKGKRSENPAKDIIKYLRDSVFVEFSSLAVFCLQAGLILSIMSLLSGLQRQYLEKKRAEGILTFGDVARLAKTILLEQQDIRQSEKETFKAIMIDEFQDNNELQKDLLFLLAEKPELANRGVPAAADLSPGKLFFVGDEKQSIYRFRGADVSVFRKLKDELQSRDIPLVTNYRSAPGLIGAFNALFGGGKFDPQGNPAPLEHPAIFAAGPELPSYEAAYSPLRAGSEGQGKLTVAILDKKDDDSETGESDRLTAVENEARFVAERIQRLLQEQDESGKQKYRPGDIAILFRSRNPQHFFEKHLRLLNIPYASEDLNGFFFGGPINDILSVLRLAAYPLDRAAYAEMLHSPFAGVSLPGLATCLAVLGETEAAEPFTDEPLARLAEADKQHYLLGQSLYKSIREKASCKSVSALVSELWYMQGYRYETEWNPQTAVYSELYDYLFHLAALADANNRGLAAFTDSIHAMRDSEERLSDIEIPLERPGAVHLMTVHKSKGLEFPVVFLCNCGKRSKVNNSGDVFDSGETGIAFTPPLPPVCAGIKGVKRNFLWERTAAEERRKQSAELRRLLYVGMTRAEKELYLTGCLKIDDEQETKAQRQKLDFSLCLKKHTAEKIAAAAGKNAIPGDSILDNDTFFGLLLPALVSHIPDKGLDVKSSFFSLEEIPVYREAYIKKFEDSAAGFANNQNGLNAFIKIVEAFYRKQEIIYKPDCLSRRVTPTSLKISDAEKNDELTEYFCPSPHQGTVIQSYSGEDAHDVFDKVDALLYRNALQRNAEGGKFNSGGFGTIAHVCAEALLNGKEAVIPPKLAAFLTPEEAAQYLEAGIEIASRFVRSPLGKLAQNADMRRSELAFKSLLHDSFKREIFINGTIDLLFEHEKIMHVVDFKTDSKENPKEHVVQLACYYHATHDIFAINSDKNCRVWLYYLRSGKALEMTERVKRFNLRKALL
jgi:ATP-dependent helicase/nuclease subunit A